MRISDILRSANCNIICGAPGMGKTSLGLLGNIIDLTSSPYRWLDYSENNLEEKKGLYFLENPNFATDYMNAIKEAVKTYDIVLLPLLATKYLDETSMNYALAFQSLSLVDVVRSRLIQRGNTELFINECMDSFVRLNEVCKSDDNHWKFEVNQNDLFLGEIISRDEGWFI